MAVMAAPGGASALRCVNAFPGAALVARRRNVDHNGMGSLLRVRHCATDFMWFGGVLVVRLTLLTSSVGAPQITQGAAKSAPSPVLKQGSPGGHVTSPPSSSWGGAEDPVD